MTFDELQEQVGKYVYTEDNGMARIALAAIVANRLKLGDPVWMLLIGASSSGKSQILRPIALTDKKYIHRVDDLTENTFLSGTRVKQGEQDISLLKRIGAAGIIVISDLTVIFSKSSETRAAILGQLRMVYDGEMTKFSGTSNKPIHWSGYMGMLVGSTPSIYTHFEEVADMGERFIYYRMKPYDIEKATRRSLSRTVFGHELDTLLADLYGQYIKESVQFAADKELPTLSLESYDRIVNVAMLAAKLRTPIHYDRFSKTVDKIPVSEMPMRVAQQLCALARGLMVLRSWDTGGVWELHEYDIRAIEWCAYSLANEERRACMRVLAGYDNNVFVSTKAVADQIGLSTDVIRLNLQHLAAIGLLRRNGLSGDIMWQIADVSVWKTICNIEDISHNMEAQPTVIEVSAEDIEESERAAEMEF